MGGGPLCFVTWKEHLSHVREKELGGLPLSSIDLRPGSLTKETTHSIFAQFGLFFGQAHWEKKPISSMEIRCLQ